VDFGSSDAQVLDGRFSDMNQALIDVHGESSWDTLIRDNEGADSNLGVIVGGGGREVHCNDGPRHHVQFNTMHESTISALSVSDHTPEVYALGNDLDASTVLFTAAFGARDVVVERNDFGDAPSGAVVAVAPDTGPLVVRRNRFRSHCTPETAVLALGVDAPLQEANTYCEPGTD